MKTIHKVAKRLFCCVLLFVFSFLIWQPTALSFKNEGSRYAITAKADAGDSIEIKKYEVEMTLGKDRRFHVIERIQVEFLKYGLSMFYRSLPKTGAKYENFSATCEGNDEFSYEVAQNPDYDEFIDVNCMGGTQKNSTWIYVISYTMLEDVGNKTDGMIIDVIGAGWPVDLHDVSVRVNFPDKISEDYKVYIGHNDKDGTAENGMLSADGKTWYIHKDELSVSYNGRYDEYMAEPITLDFKLPDGTFDSYASIYVFTEDLWLLIVVGLVALGISILSLFYFRKKRDIVTVVNIKAPDDMDPLKMGKWLDGVVDSEDITSMVYYFADKGYLHIDLSDDTDPVLIKIKDLSEDTPVYVKTLFKGLFKSGNRVATSDLSEKFYAETEKAKRQLPSPKMYDKKSKLGFFMGGILGLLFGIITPFILGKSRFGGGYAYGSGLFFAIPIIAIWLLAYIRENYRYKWKSATFNGVAIALFLIAVAFILLFTLVMAEHFMFKSEVGVLSICALGCTLITIPAISREEKYVEELGEILGFKDFILYTEEDKIKVMLEENPELYYKILPYAQVLGVTKEWEEKFEKLLIPPPTWCEGTDLTVFDYMLLNRCMRMAMLTAMTPPQSDSTVGRGGGGGSFGGFGGGGFGGGGGGAR